MSHNHHARAAVVTIYSNQTISIAQQPGIQNNNNLFQLGSIWRETVSPSPNPNIKPSTSQPSARPSNNPSTNYPSIIPSVNPTTYPSDKPTISDRPSFLPSNSPTIVPREYITGRLMLSICCEDSLMVTSQLENFKKHLYQFLHPRMLLTVPPVTISNITLVEQRWLPSDDSVLATRSSENGTVNGVDEEVLLNKTLGILYDVTGFTTKTYRDQNQTINLTETINIEELAANIVNVEGSALLNKVTTIFDEGYFEQASTLQALYPVGDKVASVSFYDTLSDIKRSIHNDPYWFTAVGVILIVIFGIFAVSLKFSMRRRKRKISNSNNDNKPGEEKRKHPKTIELFLEKSSIAEADDRGGECSIRNNSEEGIASNSTDKMATNGYSVSSLEKLEESDEHRQIMSHENILSGSSPYVCCVVPAQEVEAVASPKGGSVHSDETERVDNTTSPAPIGSYTGCGVGLENIAYSLTCTAEQPEAELDEGMELLVLKQNNSELHAC